jgi:hypothetical protein
MIFKLTRKYLSGAAFALSASLNGALGLSAFIFTVLTASLPPDAKVLIYSKEGQAFLAASWAERALLRNLIDPPRGEAAQRRLLVRVLDELQTRAGQEFAAAGLNLAQRPEFESELARVRAGLKKAVRRWFRSNAKARAAAAEFQTYGRSIESIFEAYIDNAIHDLTKARDSYPAFVSGAGEESRERPLESFGDILDRFFERYPLPDLSFVKTPPDQDSGPALAALNDKALAKQITALNFKKTVAPPGGLKVSLQVQGRETGGIVAAGGFEFLRELEANERCFVERYRHANGYPVVVSYEKGADLISAPACLSTDLIAGTIAGPLNFHPVTVVRIPYVGQLRPNLADKETRNAVFTSTVNRLSGTLWLLPPQTGRKFIRMLEQLFPAAMQDIGPHLPGPDESVWTSTRDQLLQAEKVSGTPLKTLPYPASGAG